jgi:hypothetical protein
MAKVVQFHRGTTTDLAGYAGAAGEIVVDTTKNVAVVCDGLTAGGQPLAKEATKLTEAERDAITTWAEGDHIWNLDIHRPQFYDGATWITIGG